MATRDLSRTQVGRRVQATYLRPGRVSWPLALLVVGALLALLAAYSIRPFESLDLGANSDYPYLQGFHAREFSAIEPSQRFDWPAGSQELTISDGLNPAFAMATFTLDSLPAGLPRRLASVYVNGQEIDTITDNGGGRDFRVLLPNGVTAGPTLDLRIEPLLDRTDTVPPPLQVKSVTLSAAATYRWSTEQGTITFPSLGRGTWQVQLQAVVAHPDKSPVHARLLANGVEIAQLPDYADSRRISVLVPESVASGGDLTLTIAADPYRDPRPLGVLVENVAIAPVGAASIGTALPPWGLLLSALAVVIGMYGALRWLHVWRWLAAAAGLAVALVGAWALVTSRLTMGLYLPPLALLALFSAALTPLSSWAADRLFRWLDIPLAPWLRRALVLIFIVGFWLKGGAMVFPYMQSIDIHWHMEKVRLILNGHLAELYQPGAFSESVMPVDEWGPNRPVIPYSPFFHIFSTVFALFPWSLERSANLFSALVDTSRVFLLAILTRKAGLSNRTTLFAALMLAVTPVTFLLHAWGNVPTTFGIWWTFVVMTVIVALYERLHERGPFILLTLVTLACMLFYTVMAVFHVVFITLFVAMVLVLGGRVDRRPLKPMLLATGLGIVLSIVIYYGLYIPSMIERTLPYMAELFTQGPQSVGVERPPFSQYMLTYLPHLDYHIWPGDYLYYGLYIPLLFVIPGFVALWSRRLVWATFAAWFTVGVLFMFAGYRMSMVDKQLFYILPPMMICWAVYADRFWERGRWGKLFVSMIYIFTFLSALNLWIIRIERSPIS
ncbi:MAG TPA: hypothetical protein VFT66_21970 [Roseiflexaceae bacterium]|nr:hypothetical protein [Roseiflexaceae bacterium]